MSTRILALVVVLFAAVWVGWAAMREQAPVRAAPAAEDSSSTVPRTSWGDPDLQGVWDYRTITPLERRPELGDREFYTDEEIAELEGRAGRRMDKPPDESTPANLVHAEYLTDPGRLCGGIEAHVAHRRSAQRENSRVDGRGGAAASAGSGRRTRTHRRPCRLVSRSHVHGTLHHAGSRRRTPAGSVQQQHPHLAGSRLRRDCSRDDPRDACRAARRQRL